MCTHMCPAQFTSTLLLFLCHSKLLILPSSHASCSAKNANHKILRSDNVTEEKQRRARTTHSSSDSGNNNLKSLDLRCGNQLSCSSNWHRFHVSLVRPIKMINTAPRRTCAITISLKTQTFSLKTESWRLEHNSWKWFVWSPLHRTRLFKTETKRLKWALENSFGNIAHKREKYSAKMLAYSKNALSSSLLIFIFGAGFSSKIVFL